MDSHELNSVMIYIHPPLAIVGYIFIFLFALLLIKKRNFNKKITRTSGLAAWLLTFLGLLMGMFWAQVAWGSYWSWDPKETMTLLIFLALSAQQIAYFEKKQKATRWLSIISCALVIITGELCSLFQGFIHLLSPKPYFLQLVRF